MSEDKNTKQNVVGIGDNNTYSKEQYEKVVKSLHHIFQLARQEASKIREMYDSAFTGYWHGHGDKLKTHEKHERRQDAINVQSKFSKYCDEHIAAIEAKAKARGIELENSETEIAKEKDKNDN